MNIFGIYTNILYVFAVILDSLPVFDRLLIMKRLRFNNLPMAVKISLLLLPILIVFFVTDEIAFSRMEQTIYNETQGSASESLESTASNLDSSFRHLEEVFTALSKDTAVRQYLNYYTYEQFVGSRGETIELLLTKQFRTYLSSSADIDSIGIILSRYRMKHIAKDLPAEVTAAISDYVKLNYPSSKTAARLFAKDGTDYTILFSSFSIGSRDFVLFAVLNPSFFHALHSNTEKNGVEYWLYDGDTLIFRTSFDNISASETAKEAYQNDSQKDHFSTDIESRTYMVSSLAGSEWTLVAQPTMRYPEDAISAAHRISTYSRVIAVVIMLLLFVMIIVTFTRQVRELNSIMKKVEDGDRASRFESPYSDEISQLGHHMNNMVLQIREQESEMDKKQMQIKESQLKALQNQINPHFLYNSLEHIRMQAIDHNEPVIADQVRTMGEMLRYNIQNDFNTVSVRQEFDQVMRYLNMQKYLLGDRLNIVFDTDDSVMDYPTIKFLLQPLVENAIIHGISPKIAPSDLFIGIKDDCPYIDFEISDTGIGIDPEKLNLLLLDLAEGGPDPNASVGLRNVNERLTLFYGPDSALKIESVPGQGTAVTFRIPSTGPDLPVEEPSSC